MSQTMPYCKAYLVKDLRAYPEWKEDVAALIRETEEVGHETREIPRDKLDDDDILYLHDDYVVTDGIIREEHLVFAEVTDDWKRFCHDQLAFEVPEYEPIEIQPGPAATDASAPDASDSADAAHPADSEAAGAAPASAN
jgi:hypothetical protein